MKLGQAFGEIFFTIIRKFRRSNQRIFLYRMDAIGSSGVLMRALFRKMTPSSCIRGFGQALFALGMHIGCFMCGAGLQLLRTTLSAALSLALPAGRCGSWRIKSESPESPESPARKQTFSHLKAMGAETEAVRRVRIAWLVAESQREPLEDQTCAICLEPFSDSTNGPVLILDCHPMHCFHTGCLGRAWHTASRPSLCPMCRSNCEVSPSGRKVRAMAMAHFLGLSRGCALRSPSPPPEPEDMFWEELRRR